MTGVLAAAARRPVAVLMVVTAVVVFGVVSYNRLDLALLPDLNYPTLTVRTEFPGAGPRDVDKRITEVLEKRLSTTSGLVSITSVSRSGFSDITLEFSWDAPMGVIRSDLDAKIAAATLPDEAKRPLILPYDPSLDPIMRIAVSSKGRTEQDLALARRLAEEEVEKELKKLPGVAAAKIRGGREREIAVFLDEDALARTGIRLQDVVDALSGANRNEAAGLINEGPIEYVVRSVNELRSVAEIEDLVVTRTDGIRHPGPRHRSRRGSRTRSARWRRFSTARRPCSSRSTRGPMPTSSPWRASVRDRLFGGVQADEGQGAQRREPARRSPPRRGGGSNGAGAQKNLSASR